MRKPTLAAIAVALGILASFTPWLGGQARAENIPIILPDVAKGFNGTILGQVYKMGDKGSGMFHITIVKVMGFSASNTAKISADKLTEIWKGKYQWCRNMQGSPAGPDFQEGDLVVLTCVQFEMHLRYTKVAPLFDAATLTQITTNLDAAEAALKSNDVPAAIKAMAKVPAEAALAQKFADRITAAQKAIGDAGDALLAQIDPLIEQKQYAQAASKLKELADSLAGTPTGNKAKEKLAALASNPAYKEQAEAAKKSEQAAAALAAAQKLKANKKDDLAYSRFKEIVTAYAGTEAATTAAQEVQAYEKDAAFMAHYSRNAVSGKAKAALSVADSYRAAGNQELAKKKYREVIDKYPDTDFAKTAQQALEEMGGEVRMVKRVRRVRRLKRRGWTPAREESQPAVKRSVAFREKFVCVNRPSFSQGCGLFASSWQVLPLAISPARPAAASATPSRWASSRPPR